MADLSGWIILDGRSGTFFSAEDATLIDTSRLTPEELQDLEEGTDTDRLLLAEKRGKALHPDCPL